MTDTTMQSPANSGAPLRLRGMTQAELEQMTADAGFPAFRGRQLFHWLHRKMARTLDEMKNLPVAFREWLATNAVMGGVKDVVTVKTSQDGSYKFLFELEDGRKVESVLMPDAKRTYWTQCLSSQVGCAVDCKFCVTGFNGFFRQMKVDEIVDQVLFARRHLLTEQPGANFRNLVYMGMGEPLLNPDAVIKSIRLFSDREGVDLSPRRITVSTSGIVPGMVQLAEAETGACLALSLNAPNQAERERIMPITKKYPLADVLDVCRRYRYGKHKRVTFEYVLLAGINDTTDHARQVASLVKGIPCKINVIPFNPNPTLPFGRPETDDVQAFVDVLGAQNYTVSVRWSKALDVDGACGQLAGQHRQRRGIRGVEAPAATPEPTPAQFAHALGDLDFFAPVAAESADEDDGEDIR
ncbi:23S rRNA (adenine(2503)-C(2))-methyltransferase RlmN [bacterium]|nr:23S rRNA (adenine(2503)-C(2))-methyltransferase RlmN [bacterium]